MALHGGLSRRTLDARPLRGPLALWGESNNKKPKNSSNLFPGEGGGGTNAIGGLEAAKSNVLFLT